MRQITMIPASDKTEERKEGHIRRRTAAYARVSTDKEEQASSYETQIAYYTKRIEEDPDLEFVGVFTDEGISGTSTRKRKGFNKMMNEALKGKLDLILTKSVSRFARNTVDSLVSIRRLKEAGCEVYFEKENIYTFDGKGELFITIMSSLAQEESRSLSENVTWGMRRRFADGRYSMHFSEFLGYARGEKGEPVIDEKEAAVVRMIYCMCREGLSPYTIAKILTKGCIPTPAGREKWHGSVVRSILENEKYKGDALLQKTFSTSFLTKKRKRNEGELPQYYVENGHPAIVTKSVFEDAARALQCLEPSRFSESCKEYSKRVKCGVCGRWCTEAVWNNGHAGQHNVWRCYVRVDGKNCGAPNVPAEVVADYFAQAEEHLVQHGNLMKKCLSLLRTSAGAKRARREEQKQIDLYLSHVPDSPIAARKKLLDDEIAHAEATTDLWRGITALPKEEAGRRARELGLFRRLIDYITLNGTEGFTAVFLDGSQKEFTPES